MAGIFGAEGKQPMASPVRKRHSHHALAARLARIPNHQQIHVAVGRGVAAGIRPEKDDILLSHFADEPSMAGGNALSTGSNPRGAT